MSDTVCLLQEALKRHSRWTKEIARRHGYDPCLILIIRDAQGLHPPVIVNEDPSMTESLLKLGEYLEALRQDAP